MQSERNERLSMRKPIETSRVCAHIYISINIYIHPYHMRVSVPSQARPTGGWPLSAPPLFLLREQHHRGALVDGAHEHRKLDDSVPVTRAQRLEVEAPADVGVAVLVKLLAVIVVAAVHLRRRRKVVVV